ncbi:MAG: methionine--tRNA ligase [Patescibacteria group bacterium]
MITYDEFKKVELKIGEIKTAERVVGSEKLLKLAVEIGGAAPRQIIAGIGKVYEPETLLGKQIVIVTNLEPRIIMGLESQGMVLAADGASGPVVLLPERSVATGAMLK